MENRHEVGDCALIEQAILNRYPLILVECNQGINSHIVSLRLRPHSPAKEIHLAAQDLLDDDWLEMVDRAVRELPAM
jgi:hypothetical protein